MTTAALLDAITAVVEQVSPDKADALARRIGLVPANSSAFVDMFSAPTAELVRELASAWERSGLAGEMVSAMIMSASHAFKTAQNRQSVELVWTGPKTPCVAPRRTEQALLQVIDAAKRKLFVTTFVAYLVPSIVEALNSATHRGVAVSVLLESAQGQGGSLDVDFLNQMRGLVPAARVLTWRRKADEFLGGKVHAKVAVADGQLCFVTSANLTGFALERNMEAGVLIRGGQVPTLLQDHLEALVSMSVVQTAG
jgi:cardiolipin synthase